EYMKLGEQGGQDPLTARKENNFINRWVCRVDGAPLWALGFLLLLIWYLPVILLGENVLFEIADQLDETLFTYVVNGKYLFSGAELYPEMMGGLSANSFSVSAPLFVILYHFLPTFQAFCIQDLIIGICAFFGMYACVKEITGSNLGALCAGGMFLFLPFLPVYGLSVMGGPLLIYAYVALYRKKHVSLCFLLILFFTATAHLVLLGYVALITVFLVCVWKLAHKEWNLPFYIGGVLLPIGYALINGKLFRSLVTTGSSETISHRTEMVNYASDFKENVVNLFLGSGQHAFSYHKYLILPVLAVTIIYAVRVLFWGDLHKISPEPGPKPVQDQWNLRKMTGLLLGLWGCVLVIALFYGFYYTRTVVDFRNAVTGILHYFQMQRFYFAYPTLWYLMAGICVGLILKDEQLKRKPVFLLLFLLTLLPTVINIKDNSTWFLNIRQYNDLRSGGDGLDVMSWKQYFGEDVYQQIAEQIETRTGEGKEEYRVASLGVSPAVALHNGFYTIDGYSNNYPLAYKKDFREIIAKELEQTEAMRLYFDEWGSRCCLFNHESQNYYYLKKGADFSYKELDLDTSRMRELGCEYLFSGAKITEENADRLGISLFDVFDTTDSYYRRWVYALSVQ
ncbi:MAG: DUF6044 family protein, partial [Lachnospiraceae bacterium]|nr:DUF6044 family protein [Lachnospiraceae bacterium]